MVGLLKRQVAGGEYAIDAGAVAEAILTRRRERDVLHALCSEMLVASAVPDVEPREGEPFAPDHPS